MQTPQETRNKKFEQHRAAHPTDSYAEWLHESAVRVAKSGGRHATLGSNLGYDDWWKAGKATSDRYLRLFPFRPSSRVVDYGCGSLRIGGHFIRYLDPGRYLGLDVTTGLIEVGKDLIGAALLEQKKPEFAALDEASLMRAAAFGADIVCSTAVCYHVHPDEAPTYFGNLARLAHKPGATLAFDASVSDTPAAEHALSMPIDYYVQALAPMTFVKLHVAAKRAEETIGIAEFRRG